MLTVVAHMCVCPVCCCRPAHPTCQKSPRKSSSRRVMTRVLHPSSKQPARLAASCAKWCSEMGLLDWCVPAGRQMGWVRRRRLCLELGLVHQNGDVSTCVSGREHLIRIFGSVLSYKLSLTLGDIAWLLTGYSFVQRRFRLAPYLT
jgi:hypothetical protein